MLRRESQYALEALLVLASQPVGTVLLLRHVADAANLPADFLARILQKLKRHKLVASHRGAARGYSLAAPAHKITLLEIFEAVEGPSVFRQSIFSSRRATDPPRCRLEREWGPISARLRAVMRETTLAQVAARSAPQRSDHKARHAYA